MDKTVVLIDNSCSKKAFVRAALLSGNFSVVEAGSAEEAIRQAGRMGPVDLAVLCMKPSGVEPVNALKSIRSSSSLARVPVLMLLDDAPGDEQLEWKDAGATGWVAGPLTPEKIVNAVMSMVF